MPRNFAVRLSCPHGDSDSWVTISHREESLEQILQQTWDFKCREHGPQQGIPEEAMEVAPLDDPQPPSTPVSFAVPFPATPAKKTPRSSERIPMRVPVVIYGFAGKGGAFHEDAETILINSSGALVTLKAKLALGDTVFLVHKGSRQEQEVRVVYLDAYSDRETRVGVGFLTTPGQTIEVRRLWRKARFRVVWIGQVGSTESNQVGVVLQSAKNIWRVEVPKSAKHPQTSKPPEK